MTNAQASVENVFAVLDESLPVIHAALIGYYRFTEPEAEAFNDTLAVWFHRVVRRAGRGALATDRLREQLLFVACKYANAFQLAKINGDEDDRQAPVSVQTPPEEVAVALLNRLRPAGGAL